MNFFIYGLYWRGKCVYVGMSGNPEKRFKFHQARRHAPRSKLRVFRSVRGKAEALRIETQVIKAMRRRGQAKLNVLVHDTITCLTTGQVFSTRQAFCRRYRITEAALILAITKRAGFIPHLKVTVSQTRY